MEKPNILWYCTDQQRFDTIQSLGNCHINTPNLDMLIENSVTFTQAYTQSPICTPSRATFLTGRYPATHHVNRNGANIFPSNEVLVTKTLSDAGYDCGLVGKLHLSRAQDVIEVRPDDGYRVFHWSHHPYPDWPEGHNYADWLKKEKNININNLYEPLKGISYGPGVPSEYHQTTWCTEMTLKFIEEERDGPWLMSVNPFDPHPPFDPPEKYLNRYNPDEMPYPLFKIGDLERQKKFSKVDQQTIEAFNPYNWNPMNKECSHQNNDDYAHSSSPPKNYDARMIKACYYGTIELIDNQFGRIIKCLQKTGQLNNTVIIFTSDHGELLGDHGLLYKGCRFFESLVHVPLIISWPKRFKRGLRSKSLVELIDLAPTLLEIAEIPIPDYMQGKSLTQLLTGETNPKYHKPHVISEYNDALPRPNASHGTMYFDGRYKSIIYHGTQLGEIYDHESDPKEFDDLWDNPQIKDIKKELLLRHFDAIMATSSAGIHRSGRY